MAYTINLTDGTVFATINDGTITQIASGTPSVPLITLVGKNYAGYGAFLDSNFVHLLESGSNSVAPTAPLTGQLWWDSTNNILKIYSGTGFKSITGATSSASAPTTTVIAGDLWFDTSNQQLKVYTGSTWLVVGPGYTSAQGTSGAIPETILNSVGATKYITSLYVNNTRVGVVYDGASFTPQVSLQAAFPTIYPGLTLSASVSGAVFAGSATNAQLLDSLDSSDFMRATANTATTGRLQVNNANGIYIGTSNVVNISQSTNDGLITAAVSGGNLIIQTNVAGTTYNVARALGASGTFAISNAATVGTTLSVTGNVTGGNLITAAAISAASVSASANVTGGNLNAGTGNISSTGNVIAGNIISAGVIAISNTSNTSISTSGNVQGSYFYGNGSQLTGLSLGVTVTKFVNGTTEGNAGTSGGNINFNVGGVSNVLVLTTGTAYFVGTANVTGLDKSGTNAVGNIGSSINYFNTMFAATYNGATVSASGNITGGNVLGGANVNATSLTGTTVSVTGNISGGNVLGGALVNATSLTGTTVSVTGNITGGNVLVSGVLLSTNTVSATGNITGGNVLGGANVNATTHTGATVSVSGNITGGNLNAAGLSLSSNVVSALNLTSSLTAATTISAVGNITGGNILGGANVNATTHTGSTVSVTSTVTGSSFTATAQTAFTANVTNAGIELGLLNGVNSPYIDFHSSGNASADYDARIIVTGGNVGGLSGTGTVTVNASMLSASTAFSAAGNITGGNLTVSTGTVTLGNVVNSNSTGVGNIGSSTTAFNTVFALATSAQYADLAERYAADAVLEPGTVVDLGGTHEITRSQQDLSDAVFGVISTSAAYMMNNGAGSDATHPLVAIAGRVPVKVIGTVQKGNRLVSAGNGVARAAQPGEATWVNVIGRALENKDSTELGMIEATVSVK